MKDSGIISLVGMTGCGKTSIGRRLADNLGADFIDLDEEIVKRRGEVKQIFATEGEEAFRKIEFDVLLEILNGLREQAKADNQENTAENSTESSVEDSVRRVRVILSCGGGAPTYPRTRDLIRKRTVVVWIRRPLSSISPNSPLLERPPVNGSLKNYRQILGKRFPIYRHIADYSFWNTYPNRTANAIADALRSGKTQKKPDKKTKKPAAAKA